MRQSILLPNYPEQIMVEPAVCNVSIVSLLNIEICSVSPVRPAEGEAQLFKEAAKPSLQRRVGERREERGAHSSRQHTAPPLCAPHYIEHMSGMQIPARPEILENMKISQSLSINYNFGSF